jgi:hypothetical protein
MAGFASIAEERGPEGRIVSRSRQESAGRDAQGAAMMETWSFASLVVPEPDLPLEVLVVASMRQRILNVDEPPP